ncbi:MAG: DUF47 domain-containing protein [Solirubrobacteraceae bacterium]
MVGVSRRRWFLPETPDVIGELRKQIAVTIEGVDAFASWACGNTAAADRLPEIAQRGGAAKRAVLETLRVALVTPLDPEDAFALSRGIDWILNYTRDVVAEADVMASSPDAVIAAMSACLSDAVRHLDDAIAQLGADNDAATDAADSAIKAERDLENAYYRGMGALLGVEYRSQRIARRELYRRCVRIGETVIDVAERVVYAVVKQD